MAKPNFKALAIDHGEKIALGFFGVIVLAILATTSWSRYQKTPDELKRRVLDARNKISSPENVWPKAQQDAYKIVDYTERSRSLFMPLAAIAAGRFEYSTPLYHPLYRKDEPRREPVFEPVQSLISIAGSAPISILVASEAELQSDETKPAADEEKTVAMNGDEEFPERPVALTTQGLGTGLGAPASLEGTGPGSAPRLATGTPKLAGGTTKAASGTTPRSSSTRPASGPAANSSGIFQGIPDASGSSAAGSMASMGSGVKARGVLYVAVRGVFPLAKQIENFKKALHLSHAEAANLVEIADFVLERQAATSNKEDPWKDAKWIQVRLTTAEEILGECSELDSTDPVPMALRDPVITMDLPLRLLFAWGKAATHPKIKDMELKPDEIALEDKLIEAVDQAATEANIPEPERRRGLSGKQRDLKTLAKRVVGSPDSTNLMQQMYSKMGSARSMPTLSPAVASSASAMTMSRPAGNAPGAMSNQMSSMMASSMGMGGPGMRPGNNPIDRLVSNSSRYLLFRYLDFDVEPGMAYRYRVRLQLRNPNFELTPEELGSAEPEIAKGKERETPWSNISNPEVVPSTVNFYLKQVDREPYLEEKVKGNQSKSVAQLSMFDWETKLGTVVNDVLNIWAIGGFIGETKKDTLVLDLANNILDKEKEHKFFTMNVLLDVESDAEVEASQHPDLKLAGVDKRGMARVGLVPEALIAMESGEIEMLDPFSERDEEQKWIRQREAERKGMKVGEPKKTNRLDSLLGKAAEQEDNADGKKKKRNPRRNSTTQDPSNYAQQMQRMMQPGGMAAPGAAAPGSTTRGRSNSPRPAR